jgi:hypothetical protein
MSLINVRDRLTNSQPGTVCPVGFHRGTPETHCVQGAPTSRGTRNTLVLPLQRPLNGLANKPRLAYTRIARDEGFEVIPQKTRSVNRGTRQSVTDVVLKRVLGLSRQERRRLRAAVQQHAYVPCRGATRPAPATKNALELALQRRIGNLRQ